MKTEVIEIRKYPNRRFYNVNQSCHIGLEEIHRLIMDGKDVRITESKTGNDITGQVLTQILLERDVLKLEAFPVKLLHALLRSNERVLHEFVETYFSQAFKAFSESQQQFQSYLRQSLGLGAETEATNSWTQSMVPPFMTPFFNDPKDKAPESPTSNMASEEQQGRDDKHEDLRQTVEELKAQINEMRNSMGK